MVFIDQEEVIEIAADFSCRIHDGIDIELIPFREWRECMRQHRFLNVMRHAEFCLNTLPFRGNMPDSCFPVCKLFFHSRHDSAEIFNFISSVNIQFCEMVIPFTLGVFDVIHCGLGNGIDGLHHLLAGVIRHEVDDKCNRKYHTKGNANQIIQQTWQNIFQCNVC